MTTDTKAHTTTAMASTTPSTKGRSKKTGLGAAKTPGKKRGPKPGSKRLAGTTRGASGALLRTVLKQNGFSDGGTLTITEGRKTLTLPLGFFSGK